tara:strand:+ start:153 stop:446 length:294 start_codon:yes stop_codon:yes gene_type:complete
MSKELDQYIRRLVREVPSVIEDIIEHKDIGHTHVYYSGEWQQDVFDNFTIIQSEKIFKKMSKYLSNPNLSFYQKRIEEGNYDYYVRKVKPWQTSLEK